ncbi:MAG: hypothetical protein LBL45_12620 [Treponema sp.]|jgi:hypothetical protein|nr:hypothetical protein [Treponema sp.]
MNKPMGFFSIIFVFLTSYVMADALSQTDLYGTWKCTSDEETLLCLFTEDALTVTLDDDEPLTAKILQWEQVDNLGIETSQLFPNGFKLAIQALDGDVTSFMIYIDKEKKHFLISELPEDYVFTRQ